MLFVGLQVLAPTISSLSPLLVSCCSEVFRNIYHQKFDSCISTFQVGVSVDIGNIDWTVHLLPTSEARER